MTGSLLSLGAQKQGNCEDQDSFLLHGIKKKCFRLLTSFADLSGRAVPSSLGCPQESCQEASANPVFTVSAFLGPREGRRQDLGGNTCSPSSVHIYSGAPAAGVIPPLPLQLLQEPPVGWEGKVTGRGTGQPACAEWAEGRARPQPCWSLPSFSAQGPRACRALPTDQDVQRNGFHGEPGKCAGLG